MPQLTEQVVVEDHAELGQLHCPGGELHGEYVRRRSKAVRRHPEVTPSPVQKETKKKTTHMQLAKMSFDEILDLTADV